jgi:hypothetical protein
LDPSKFEEFANRVSGFGVVIKDGYLAYRWRDHERAQDWFSAAKPVLSTLRFLAVQGGRLASGDDFAGCRGYHVRLGGDNLAPYDWSAFADFADTLWRRYDGFGSARAERPGNYGAFGSSGKPSL